ncbi:cytochrome b [Marinivivus vitaminiproducens]|uniref:cytochrome b n=1 Tax=Marinivivus vitaminiproducens TaxID=3035935 RepID=UPI00279F0D08|nr:cytochrome b [Geminicoccaceae bacterium SCSIO 64248]
MSVPTNRDYTTTAKALHWLIVILILWQFASAWTWPSFPRGDPTRGLLATMHVYSGVTILALAAIRLAWRLTHPAPPLPDGVPDLQQRLARAVQGLLYVMIFVQPISGLFVINTEGPSHDTAEAVHGWGETLILVLAGLHVLGALYHHFVRKDDVLRTMLPNRG